MTEAEISRKDVFVGSRQDLAPYLGRLIDALSDFQGDDLVLHQSTLFHNNIDILNYWDRIRRSLEDIDLFSEKIQKSERKKTDIIEKYYASDMSDERALEEAMASSDARDKYDIHIRDRTELIIWSCALISQIIQHPKSINFRKSDGTKLSSDNRSKLSNLIKWRSKTFQTIIFGSEESEMSHPFYSREYRHALMHREEISDANRLLGSNHITFQEPIMPKYAWREVNIDAKNLEDIAFIGDPEIVVEFKHVDPNLLLKVAETVAVRAQFLDECFFEWNKFARTILGRS